jgi:hypothetical protein
MTGTALRADERWSGVLVFLDSVLEAAEAGLPEGGEAVEPGLDFGETRRVDAVVPFAASFYGAHEGAIAEDLEVPGDGGPAYGGEEAGDLARGHGAAIAQDFEDGAAGGVGEG